jgi:hypothetical protein
VNKIAAELAKLYEQRGGLNPAVVVDWARAHPKSALHARFEWDNTTAAKAYRLWQARKLITEVEVIYPDKQRRQVYVSPVESRGDAGYASLVDVLSDAERRAAYLSQALAEYERAGDKYADLEELAGVRREVAKARERAEKRGARKAA